MITRRAHDTFWGATPSRTLPSRVVKKKDVNVLCTIDNKEPTVVSDFQYKAIRISSTTRY